MKALHFIALAAVAVLVAGCGDKPEPVTQLQTVKVAVPVPCAPQLPLRPELLGKDEIRARLAAIPLFDDRVKLVTDQLLLYMGWVPVLEAGLKGCKGVPK